MKLGRDELCVVLERALELTEDGWQANVRNGRTLLAVSRVSRAMRRAALHALTKRGRDWSVEYLVSCRLDCGRYEISRAFAKYEDFAWRYLPWSSFDRLTLSRLALDRPLVCAKYVPDLLAEMLDGGSLNLDAYSAGFFRQLKLRGEYHVPDILWTLIEPRSLSCPPGKRVSFQDVCPEFYVTHASRPNLSIGVRRKEGFLVPVHYFID